MRLALLFAHEKRVAAVVVRDIEENTVHKKVVVLLLDYHDNRCEDAAYMHCLVNNKLRLVDELVVIDQVRQVNAHCVVKWF